MRKRIEGILLLVGLLMVFSMVGFGAMVDISALPTPTSTGINTCNPEFESGIIFDPDNPEKAPTVFTPGESIPVKIKIGHQRGCTGEYNYTFTSDNSDITFQSIVKRSSSLEAIMQIGLNIDLDKNAIIAAGGEARKNTSEIRIVSNMHPTAKPDYPNAVPSFAYFDVDCSGSLSGDGFNESGDRVWRCKVVIMDEKGEKVISTDEIKVKPGQKMPLLRVKTGVRGVNQIVVEVEDTLGATSKFSDIIDVSKGDTEKDIPIVFISSTISCFRNEECPLDASETVRRDDNVSGFNYILMNGEKEVGNLKNLQGIDCKASICRSIFNTSGTFPVKVKANYFMKDKFGYKIIIVNIIDRPGTIPATSVQPNPAITQVPSVQPTTTYLPVTNRTATNQTEYDRPKIPDIGIFWAIATIVLAAIRRKK